MNASNARVVGLLCAALVQVDPDLVVADGRVGVWPLKICEYMLTSAVRIKATWMRLAGESCMPWRNSAPLVKADRLLCAL